MAYNVPKIVNCYYL